MKVTYDSEADAAYIYLTDYIDPGGVARTLPCEFDINLDFDSENRFLGVEVLHASKRLSQRLLKVAEDITRKPE